MGWSSTDPSGFISLNLILIISAATFFYQTFLFSTSVIAVVTQTYLTHVVLGFSSVLTKEPEAPVQRRADAFSYFKQTSTTVNSVPVSDQIIDLGAEVAVIQRLIKTLQRGPCQAVPLLLIECDASFPRSLWTFVGFFWEFDILDYTAEPFSVRRTAESWSLQGLLPTSINLLISFPEIFLFYPEWIAVGTG